MAGLWAARTSPSRIRTVSVMYSHVLRTLRFQVLDLHWSPVAPWSDCRFLPCYNWGSAATLRLLSKSHPSKLRSESNLGRSPLANTCYIWKEQRKERGARASCRFGHSWWANWVDDEEAEALSQTDTWARRRCILKKKKKTTKNESSLQNEFSVFEK